MEIGPSVQGLDKDRVGCPVSSDNLQRIYEVCVKKLSLLILKLNGQRAVDMAKICSIQAAVGHFLVSSAEGTVIPASRKKKYASVYGLSGEAGTSRHICHD
jgi:hypothetical protein